ncbi:FAD-dependent oxidoreductase [Pacificimonas flava]|uniref:FAD-dependent oxidoreductase n=2 Tax=Pacificimonas TaxID=1960290 RepID=A0A219B3B6_9SPHN|nr:MULTISPECIES: FAD-binding oxidoreductase [Pacificimonas]MBZ6377706.1 FAD-binding oxidoreductase [Pacificimonas aurantium]OWV32616.1 FAD-dependent oxidoreductase [Pacificimonas flava]
MSRDAVVVGGGLIGQACACALAARGARVQLVEQSAAPRAASWGNAGHIAVEQVEPLASAKLVRNLPTKLFLRGGPVALPPSQIFAWLPFSLRLLAAARSQRFRAGKSALTAALREAMPALRRQTALVGRPDLLYEEGHLLLWESTSAAHAGRAHWSGLPAETSAFRELTEQEREALTALLGRPPADAVRFLHSGHIDPGVLADAQAAWLAEHGVEMVTARVAGLARNGAECAVQLDGGERLAAGMVVVAAGHTSAALLAPLGHKAPIIAERGYHVEAEAGDEWPADLPPLVFEDRSMIVTRFEDRVRAGGFVEFGRPDAPPDPRKWQRLRAHIADLGLPVDLPGRSWMGVRPTLPDYLPAIGRSDAASNLYYAFGHQHLGLTLSALTGDLIAALGAGEPTAVDIAPFSLERFTKGGFL